ncbi:MAG: CDP-alcohol phosphatidyltransferase family protein [Phycisphaerales bacterium JB037]
MPHAPAKPAADRTTGPLRHLPNAITIARLAMAGAFPFLPSDLWRLIFVIASGISDAVDGVLARALGAHSMLGRILDPIADKLFTLVVLVTLFRLDRLEWWSLALLLSRDILVGLVALYAACRRAWRAFGHMPPRLLGKVTTFALFAYMVAAFAGDLPRAIVYWLAVTLSMLAAVDYGVLFVRRHDPLLEASRHGGEPRSFGR